MKRLKVSILFGNKPNFNANAFKYFILSLNKVQSFYEFTFPDLDDYPFPDKTCDFETANNILEDWVNKKNIQADYHVAIISTSFNNNYFSNAEDNTAVLTSDIWDKYFSPPSLFEHLMHSTICSLIYSQKLPKERKATDEMNLINIGSHVDTRGCIADFVRNKIDDKIDILIGYVCEEHQKEIKFFYGEEYLNELLFILERKWIGSTEEKNTVAYNLKHAYKFNINKDSGFNKTLWEKCQDKFYEIPANTIGKVIEIILTALITYLLIKYGIMTQK